MGLLRGVVVVYLGSLLVGLTGCRDDGVANGVNSNDAGDASQPTQHDAEVQRELDASEKDAASPGTTSTLTTATSDVFTHVDTTALSEANDASAETSSVVTSSAETSATLGTSTEATSGATSSPSSNTSASDTSEAPLPIGTVIGVGCEEDSDCQAPTTCIRTHASFEGAFPGTGICSMPCQEDSDCGAVDLLSLCWYVGSASDETLANTPSDEVPGGFGTICMQGCFFGHPTTPKCGELSTFSCMPVNDTVIESEAGDEFIVGVCTPLCNSDSDCAPIEVCDPYWGLCLEQAHSGKAAGEPCNVNAAQPECASEACMLVAEGLDVGFCSAACNFHEDTTVCGGAPSSSALAGCYANFFSPIEPQYGDVGHCIPLCDADEDCVSGLECDVTESDSNLQYYGRPGVCMPTPESIEEALANAAREDAGSPTASEDASANVGDGG